MKRKQYDQSFLRVWHKRLLSATPDMHDMQKNVRQSNFAIYLFFCRVCHLKGLCHLILGCFGKILG